MSHNVFQLTVHLYLFSWQDLKDFMRKAGEVCYGGAHGDVGRNKGVVCYERKDDAERAVEELEGRDINGRSITLKYVVREDWDQSGKLNH